MVKGLSRASRRILKELALKNFDDKINKYRIAKRTGLSYARVYDGVRNLSERSLIDTKVVGSSRTGQPKEVYSPTLGGLAVILRMEPKLWDEIDEIARKQVGLLPSIFGRWDYFTQAGIKDLLVIPLKRNFSSFETPPRGLHMIGAEKSLKLNAIAEALWPEETLKYAGDRMRKAWVKAMIGDPDLLRFMREYLRCLGREKLIPIEGSLRDINRAREALSFKEPNRFTRGERFTRELGEMAVMESREREKIRHRKRTLLDKLEKKSMKRFMSRKTKYMDQTQTSRPRSGTQRRPITSPLNLGRTA